MIGFRPKHTTSYRRSLIRKRRSSRAKPKCEVLEDRTLLSGSSLATACDLDVEPDLFAAVIEEIDPVDDVDLFSVELFEGEVVFAEIDTRGFPTDLDSVLRIFDSSGDEVAFNDDFFELDSFIQFSVEETDEYFIGVSSFGNEDYDPITGNPTGDGFTMGSFELIVSIVPTGSLSDSPIDGSTDLDEFEDDFALSDGDELLDDDFIILGLLTDDNADFGDEVIILLESSDESALATTTNLDESLLEVEIEELSDEELDLLADEPMDSLVVEGDAGELVSSTESVDLGLDTNLTTVDSDVEVAVIPNDQSDDDQQRSRLARIEANFLAIRLDVGSGRPFDLIVNRDGFNAILTAAKFHSHLWLGTSFYEDLFRPAAYALAELLGDGDLDLWVLDEGDEIATLFDLEINQEDNDDDNTDPPSKSQNKVLRVFVRDYLANYFAERGIDFSAAFDDLLLSPSVRAIQGNLPANRVAQIPARVIALYLRQVLTQAQFNTRGITSVLMNLIQDEPAETAQHKSPRADNAVASSEADKVKPNVSDVEQEASQ